MESKGETDFTQKFNFQKTEHYFCCNITNGNTYP